MDDKLVVGKIEFEPRPQDFFHDLKMRMRRLENPIPKVFICIRLRPKSKGLIRAKREFRRNLERAKIAARYAVLNGYDPEATTIYFTQFLDDFSEAERDLGRKIGQARLMNCNELWSIRDDDETPSSEMISDMEFAADNDIPIIHKKFSEIKAWLENYNARNKK